MTACSGKSLPSDSDPRVDTGFSEKTMLKQNPGAPIDSMQSDFDPGHATTHPHCDRVNFLRHERGEHGPRAIAIL
jgi:hypothetical protein